MRQGVYQYHAIDKEEVLRLTGSVETGLSNEEARKRLERFGPNELKSERRASWQKIWLRQFKSLVVAILAAVAGVSAFYQHWLDAGVVTGIIFLNAVIGFVQEFRAEKAIEALKKLVALKVQVYRAGRLEVVFARELVVGDVIYLAEGVAVPADGRVIRSEGLEVLESALTGESLPVEKFTDVLASGTSLADRKNMVYAGTAVARGSGLVVVTATGEETALGEIALELREVKESGLLFETKANELSRQMAGLALVLAVITFGVGWGVRGIEVDEVLPFTLAALVSAIPESLPLIFMVVLTITAKRMAQRKAILRRLTAPAALGAVQAIITDKTGTITQNQMRVEKLVLGWQEADVNAGGSGRRRETARLLGLAGLLVSEVRRVENSDGTFTLSGDPTEKAYVEYCERIAADLAAGWSVLARMPFDQGIKLRAAAAKNEVSGEIRLFVVGAPENLLERSVLRRERRREVLKKVESLTTEAMRTIGFATKKIQFDGGRIGDKDLAGLTWLGAVGMTDPERPEVAPAVAAALRAGIRVIMATGDHPKTGVAIAKRVGLLTNDRVVTAVEMESMSDEELFEAAMKVEVFARMTPQSKLRLARVLQARGWIIAMTGDGVNDAPALKGADVGLAMGRGGTDVAREAGDIVLADDNFATIVAAVEEGRTQFRNLRRTSFFLVTTSTGVGITLVAFMLLGLPLPLLPKQILWLNLVGGGVTDVALAAEPVHEDVLAEKPRPSREGILNRRVVPLLAAITLLMVLLSLAVYVGVVETGGSQAKARTAVFVLLSLMQLINVYNLRSLRKSVLELPFWSNRAVNLTVPLSLAMLLMVVYFPPAAAVFEFVPLRMWELMLLTVMAAAVLLAGELFKVWDRRLEGGKLLAVGPGGGERVRGGV